MDDSYERDQLVNAARVTLAKRKSLLLQADEAGMELGAIASLLKTKYGQSRAATAKAIGMAPVTLLDWMTKADPAAHAMVDPAQRVPVLRERDTNIAAYRQRGDVTVDRVIAAVREDVVLAASGLSLDAFNDGTAVVVPMALVHDVTHDAWIGIAAATPGAYGGGGPTNLYRALVGFGIEPGLADTVAMADANSDLDVRSGLVTRLDLADLPAVPYPLPAPWPQRPGMYVYSLASKDIDEWSAYRAAGRRHFFDSWVDALTHDEPPNWLSGPLGGRVYRDESLSREDGYTEEAVDRSWTQLVLQRGRTQLRIALTQPVDPERWLPDELYTILDVLGLFPVEMKVADDVDNGKILHTPRAKLRRWLGTDVRSTHRVIHVGAAGAITPARPVVDGGAVSDDASSQ